MTHPLLTHPGVQDRIRFAVRQLIDRDGLPECAAEDLTSEFTLALLQAEPQYNPARAAASTFIAIVLRRCAAMLRRNRRLYDLATLQPESIQQQLLAGLDGRYLTTLAFGQDASLDQADCQAASTVELRLAVTDLLTTFSPQERRLCCALVDGQTVRQASQTLATPRTTVTRDLHGLRARFRSAGVTPSILPDAVPQDIHSSARSSRTAEKGPQSMPELMTSTYSMWQTFRNCRRACAWRYVHQLAPRTTAQSLAVGTLVHHALQHWHQTADLDATLALIDHACLQRAHDPDQRQAWHLARAMMTGYAQRYATEAFRVLALETTFRLPICNPETGQPSRSFELAGKIDGLVEQDGAYYLLEHKTASTLDGAYLERLWLDLQICLYSRALERQYGVPIAGVIYNVLCKAKLRQGAGESEAEFAARKAELLAKSKTGKTTAQRKQPESDADFQARLLAKYDDPAMFHREVILFTPDQYAELDAELWELTQQFLAARRRNAFYRNTSQCFAFGRPCAYYPLCRANGAQHVIDTLYERRPPHEELCESCPEEHAPVF